MGKISLKILDSSAVITIENPAKLNALDNSMLDELLGIVEECEKNSKIRSVILSGDGSKAFCAGADIRSWSELTATEFARDWIVKGHRIFDRIACLDKPTIAALNGIVFGGGLELAATFDIRVSASHVELSLPEAQVGIIPGWSGMHRLQRLIPEPVIKEMVLFGRRISAKRGFDLGFIAEISDEPLKTALEISKSLEGLSPHANEIAKAIIHSGAGEYSNALIDKVASYAMTGTEDLKEGVAAFKEKRKPKFN